VKAGIKALINWYTKKRPLSDDDGQAAVESALVLPLMTFLVLGTIQMTMMQQARIMNEYAAFQACRAGIVWNADRDKMRKAATVALLPTLANTSDAVHLAKTWAMFEAAGTLGDALSKLLGFLPGGISNAVKIVDVDIMHPTKQEFDSAGPLPGGKELDFDKVDDDKARDANRLQIRVTYLYWMKIPFANWIIHDAWMATRAGIRYSGPVDKPMSRPDPNHWYNPSGGRNRNATYAAALAKEAMSKDWERLARMTAIALLATKAGVYLIPLESTYSMRMQSNVYRDNLQY